MQDGKEGEENAGRQDMPPLGGDLRQMEEWLKLTGDSALTLVKLVKAELALSLIQIPQLIALSIALIPFMLLAWISFSVLVAWFAWSWSEEMGLAIFTFFVLQVIPSVVLVLRITRLEDGLFFPATKRQLRKFVEFMKEK